MGSLHFLARCFAALGFCAAPAWTQVSAPLQSPDAPLQGAPSAATQPLAAQLPAPSVHTRVRRGWARQHTPMGDLWVMADSPRAQTLLQGTATVGVRGCLELTVPGAWRAVVEGPARVTVTGQAELATLEFESFERVLLDVSRECRVQLPGGQQLRMKRGLVELNRRVDGNIRFAHLGGQPAELDLGGRYTFLWRAGTRRPLPPRMSPQPARRVGSQLSPGSYRTFPQQPNGKVNSARLPETENSLLESLWPF